MGQHALDSGARVGEYRIESLIAKGGMGAVYQATHPVIGKKAAVKVMNRAVGDEGEVERFIQEARAVNQIRHPNIVDVFSFGRLEDGRAYMVMELVEGEVLGHVLRNGPLPVIDAAAILRQLASAVAAAHAQGVVHRDLKPDNIMLVTHADGRRQVKLLDFGIAKLANPDDEGMMGSMTRTGLVLGTPYYMSPEQARGKEVDHRTDIYALGCITYEMLTGSVPYPSDNPTDAVIQHCQAPIPSTGAERAEVPLPLDDLVRRMLAKTSDLRPSLDEVIEELDEISEMFSDRSAFAATFVRRDKEPTPIPHLMTPFPSAPEVPPVTERRSRGLLWVGLLAVLGLSAAGAALLLDFGESEIEQPIPAGDDSASAVPAAREPSLVVEVDVAEAEVYVDGERRGTAGPRLVIPEIKPGKHRLEIRADGRITQVQHVMIADGETVRTLINMPHEVTEDYAIDAGLDGDAVADETSGAAAGSEGVRHGGSEKPETTGSRKSGRPKKSNNAGPNKLRKADERDRDYTIDPFAR